MYRVSQKSQCFFFVRLWSFQWLWNVVVKFLLGKNFSVPSTAVLHLEKLYGCRPPPTSSTIRGAYGKFLETASVFGKPCSKRSASPTTDENNKLLAQTLIVNYCCSYNLILYCFDWFRWIFLLKRNIFMQRMCGFGVVPPEFPLWEFIESYLNFTFGG